MIRIVCTSDLHGYLPLDIPNGDIFIIAGDICASSHIITQAKFINKKVYDWLNQIVLKKCQQCIFVPGNHDGVFQNAPFLVRPDMPWIYLEDSAITIDSLNFYGTPWTPMFNNWHFMADEERLKIIFDNIPSDVDVLITHGPPYGYLDQIDGVGKHLGSISLYQRLIEISPSLHIFGHIHSAHGVKYDPELNCWLINASYLDDNYNPKYKIEIFELINKKINI